MESLAAEIFENCVSLNYKPADLPNSAGLLLFTDNQDLPILLITVANIRRTVKNKLAEQAEKTKKTDLKSITAKIYYKTCPCRFRLTIMHYKAAQKTFASNYKDHITFVHPAFIKVNLNEKIPFFSVTNKQVFKMAEKILGPFPSQKTAVLFLNTLEDTFRLCRKNDLLNNPEQAKSCPYLQMDACCGVCAGKISPENYQVIIKDAFEAGAQMQKAIEKIQADMQTATKELNFEKAAQLKKKTEKLSVFKKQAYRWTGDLGKLKIVHIDKSAKIKQENSKIKKQTLAVFVMSFFEIIDLGDFVIDEFKKIAEAIENALEKLSRPCREIPDLNEISEQFSIVSYFLYRSKPSGLWLKVLDDLDSAEPLRACRGRLAEVSRQKLQEVFHEKFAT